MTALSPLSLPASDWEGWLASRCDSQLDAARRLVSELKQGAHEPAAAMSLWNDLNLALENAFSVASLMSNVHPDEAVRSRGEQAEQDAHKLLTDIGLDRELFEVLAAVDPQDLDEAGRRVHMLAMRDFRRAGVDQDENVRTRLKELAERETAVGQEFSKNIRDDVRSIRVEPGTLAGLPDDFVTGHPAGDDGLVEVTTEYPDYVPFMTFCRDRDARARLVREFLNRAWPDNDALLHELLELRREHAQLLGYDGWPSYDAEVKMIGKGSAIPEFIERITEASDAAARRDVDVLLQRLRQDHPEVDSVDNVDKMFYGEVLRRENFDVDAQEVRSYFDFAKVRVGLLEVTGRLFDVEYVEVADAASWHEDVASYDVVRGAERLGRIHLDLHPRDRKFNHAAQFELARGVRDRQLPEGVLVCNFNRGLMEHHEVVTLFHEFGHLMHHVLAGGHEWVRFSGVSTEWDFVEAPSQMLEEWARDAAVLQLFAHDAEGNPIPAELVERMRAAGEFGKGLLARTQMFYAALSYKLHLEVPEDLTKRMFELYPEYSLVAPLEGTHFHSGFGHLEGYGSAYYTYAWSLVIAKDLFSAFDHDDLLAPEVARRYRDAVLVPGGSKDAADLVEDFLGRPYDTESFSAWLNR